jgi:hypothetical protein
MKNGLNEWVLAGAILSLDGEVSYQLAPGERIGAQAPAVAGGVFAWRQDYFLSDDEIWTNFGLVVAAQNLSEPAVATDGLRTLIAWTQDGDVMAALFSNAGMSAPFLVFFDGWGKPAITWDGARFVVVAAGTNALRAASVFGIGDVSGSFEVAREPNGAGISSPCIAAGQQSTLVIWREVSNFVGNIRGARIAGDTVIDAAGFDISTAVQDELAPAVAFDGQSFVAAWRGDDQSLHGATIAEDGTVSPLVGLPGVTSSYYCRDDRPTIVPTSSGVLLAWCDGLVDGESDIRATRVLRDGSVVDPDGFPLALETSEQREPSVAHGSAGYLIAWTDTRYGYRDDVLARRIGEDGTLLDAAPIPLAVLPRAQVDPVAASDGTAWLVVWQDDEQGGLFGTVVDTDGVARDLNGRRIAATVRDDRAPALLWGSEAYLLVWLRPGQGLLGVFLDVNGDSLDDPFLISEHAATSAAPPSLAFDGESFFVTWADGRACATDIYASRVSSTGAVFDDLPIVRAPGYQLEVTTAWNGSGHIVAWRDGDINDASIKTAMVTPADLTTYPEGFDVTAGVSPAPVVPRLASSDDSMLLVWDEDQIMGAWLTSCGDPAGAVFPISATSASQPSAVAGDDSYLIAYSAWDSSVLSHRMRARMATDSPLSPDDPGRCPGQPFADSTSCPAPEPQPDGGGCAVSAVGGAAPWLLFLAVLALVPQTSSRRRAVVAGRRSA